MKKLVYRIFNGLALIVCFTGTLNGQNMGNTNNSLSTKQKCIIPIAAYTATGELRQLKSALNEGLDAGLTINEIKEIMVHLYAYCGFPRSIRGLQTFMDVLNERKLKGITDNPGAETSAIHDNLSKYEQGKANLGKLTGRAEPEIKSGYAEFAPIIDVFLKEHLFADIFNRDILAYSERELITISVLSSIGGVEPMLRSHLSICLNVGFTPQQLHEAISIIEKTIGRKEAKAAQAVLSEVLGAK